MDVADNASDISTESTPHSVSYRGSEISVFISPQPAVTVSSTIMGLIERCSLPAFLVTFLPR